MTEIGSPQQARAPVRYGRGRHPPRAVQVERQHNRGRLAQHPEPRNRPKRPGLALEARPGRLLPLDNVLLILKSARRFAADSRPRFGLRAPKGPPRLLCPTPRGPSRRCCPRGRRRPGRSRCRSRPGSRGCSRSRRQHRQRKGRRRCRCRCRPRGRSRPS